MHYKKSFLILALLVLSPLFSQKPSTKNIFEKLDLKNSSLKEIKNCFLKDKALNKLLKYYQKKENLYLSVSNEDIPDLEKKYPKEIARSIKIANQIVDQVFIFRDDWDMEKTNIPYQFKDEIDWNMDPFGDPEWTCMLNRHKFWTHLGIAYYITKDEKYAKTFVKQLEHWIDNNPLYLLENQQRNTSGTWRKIEAGIRCENWIKSFEYFKNSKHITTKFLEKFLNSLYLHGENLNYTFNNFSKTSNWGVIEHQGLFSLSIFLKEFSISKKWKQDALSKLSTCVDLQILEDGTQWERSPMYHNEVFHCLMNVNLLAQRNKIPLPNILIKKTKDMAYANVMWQKPNYHQPLLGDSDDTDTRGLLTLATHLYQDSILKSRSHKELDFENYLNLGKKINEKYEQLITAQPEFTSIYQQSSGDFYMRSSWKENATYSSLHLNKIASGHAHQDLLSFTIYANKKDYLVDNGRYTYVDNKWRKLLKENISHNSIAVDDLPHSVLKNSWNNDFEAWSKNSYTKSDAIYDYGEAESTAYERLENPVSIKRRFLFIKPNIWLIFDSFSSKTSHKYSQYFNFPNKQVEINNKKIQTSYDEKNLIIEPLKKVNIKLTDSWYSPEYNLKKESKRAEVFKNEEGFSTLITLLRLSDASFISYKKTPVYTRHNKLLTDRDAEAITITLKDKTYTILVSYNSPNIANHFFIVNNKLVHGQIILLEKENDKPIKTYIIKE